MRRTALVGRRSRDDELAVSSDDQRVRFLALAAAARALRPEHEPTAAEVLLVERAVLAISHDQHPPVLVALGAREARGEHCTVGHCTNVQDLVVREGEPRLPLAVADA